MPVAEVAMAREGSRTRVREGTRPAAAAPEAAEFRQFRHQTRNALQRLIATLHATPEMTDTEHGRRVVADLERRLCLSAAISDQLFGFRSVPGPLEGRLLALGRAIASLHAPSGQIVDVGVSADPACPAPLHDTILRVAHEMLTNAVVHGFAGRRTGTIRMRLPLEGQGSRVRLQVIDDGVGPAPGWERSEGREGLGLMREIAAEAGGSVALRREGERTIAELVLPTTARRRPG